MIVAIIRALFFSVLSLSTYLSFAVLTHVFLTPAAQTIDLKNHDAAPDLIRALPTDLRPSGCPGFLDTVSPSEASVSLPTSVLPTSFPSGLIQMAGVTKTLTTSPYDSLQHSSSFVPPHYASKDVQVHNENRQAEKNDSLFRPYFVTTTPTQLGPISRPSTDSRLSATKVTPRTTIRANAGSSEAPRNQTSDDTNLVSSDEESKNESRWENKAEKDASEKLDPNFDDNSKKLDSAAGSDRSQGSGGVIRKKSYRRGQTKVSFRLSSSRSREGKYSKNMSPAECSDRKTRFAHDSRVQETHLTYLPLRGKARMSEVNGHYEGQRERQRALLKVNGVGKMKRQKFPKERRITHLSFAPRRKGKQLSKTPHRYYQETSLGEEELDSPAINIHGKRNVNMFVTLTDSRAMRNTLRRREQDLSSLGIEEEKKQAKGDGELTKQGGRERFPAGEEFQEYKNAEGVTGEATLHEDAETQMRHPYEGSLDASLHAFHVSPFIPDLTLNDDASPRSSYLDQPPATFASLPTGVTNDPRTSTPVTFTPAKLRVTENLHEDQGGRAWQREADDPWLEEVVPGEQISERDVILPIRPLKLEEESDDTTENEFELKEHTNASELLEQSFLLPSLKDTKLGRKQGGTEATTKRKATSRDPDVPLLDTEGAVRIPCYVIIFLLGVVGNTLVIVTLLQNRKMRTVTNVFLLNLAFSDLLLGVFCMPFTLVGSLLRDFIFGAVMCRLIPYFQAVSVSVSVWTLVAISLERYYAICQPLKSRGWQTLSHAYKIISLVWLLSLVFMAPIAVLSQLLPVGDTSRHKCREMWPSLHFEQGFSMFLAAVLLLVPLVIMVAAYCSITISLWHGMKLERETGQGTESLISLTDLNGLVMVQQSLRRKQSRRHVSKISIRFRKIPAQRPCVHCGRPQSESESSLNHASAEGHSHACLHESDCESNKWRVESVRENSLGGALGRRGHPLAEDYGASIPSPCDRRPHKPDFKRLRSTHLEKSIEAKKHVIRMLFVVVLEFFLCWTPIFVVNIMCLYIPEQVYRALGSVGISFLHLLSYASSCCNPITYCFMNKKFLQGFRFAFGCRKEAERIGRKNGMAASFRSQSNNIFKLATEVKRDARETTV